MHTVNFVKVNFCKSSSTRKIMKIFSSQIKRYFEEARNTPCLIIGHLPYPTDGVNILQLFWKFTFSHNVYCFV